MGRRTWSPGPQAGACGAAPTSANSNVSRHAPHHQNGMARHRARSSAGLLRIQYDRWSWGGNAAINGAIARLEARRRSNQEVDRSGDDERITPRDHRDTRTLRSGVWNGDLSATLADRRCGENGETGRFIVRCAVVRALQRLVAARAAPDGPHSRTYGTLPHASRVDGRPWQAERVADQLDGAGRSDTQGLNTVRADCRIANGRVCCSGARRLTTVGRSAAAPPCRR
jgi:hypothetical protein